MTIRPEILSLKEELIALRRQFHQSPELGFAEKKTASFVAGKLREYGLEAQEGVAETGVVGLLRGDAAGTGTRTGGSTPGRTILIRADMDALPLQEETKAEYASKEKGVMHACGHDAHMAILLGTARILAGSRASLRGNVKVIFQPAEEGPGGALPMIQAGVLKDPQVHACVGYHVWNQLPVGKAGVQEGAVMAFADKISVLIQGKGGHGALPHQTVDPVVVAAQFITSLQSIVSRQTDPLKSAVVSIGVIRGGHAFNIIPEHVRLEGTVRTFEEQVRSEIRSKIQQLLQGVCQGMGATGTLEWGFGYPAVENDPSMVSLVSQAVTDVLGEGSVVPGKSMGGEDMAYFLKEVPGCYFFLGSSNEKKGLTAPHHSPRFNIDEDVLPIGVEILTRIVEKYLSGSS